MENVDAIMHGYNEIIDEIKEIMEAFYGEYTEHNGVIRAVTGPLGITNVHAIVDILPEMGMNPNIPYPVVHFVITLAKDIPQEYESSIKATLQDLNLELAIGRYPAFGCFCYESQRRQIFLDYRLPVNSDAPEKEMANLRYYFGTLYEELDLFADFIMYICDNEGRMPTLDKYLDYLDMIVDIDDYEERLRLFKESMEDIN